jgi:plasmid replication initiation protein
MVKKKEKTVLKLIRKSNDLVEARYKFDIWETRVFTKMLTMVRRDDDDFQNYRIYLKDIVKDFQLENNNDAYDRLRAGGMKLMSKVVKVVRNTDEGLMELSTPIVVGVEKLLEPNERVEDAKFIDISFHPKMKPFLLSLQSHFTTYDVSNILKLPSSYSIRIYELLKQYQKIGRRKFLLQELKEVIGVIEEIDLNGKKKYKDNYPLYGNFKQRVLLKAQRDLKKYTDISFEFEPIKRGRAVYELLFHIYSNQPGEEKKERIVIEPVKKKKEASLIEMEIYEQVKTWIGMNTVQTWIKKYPIEQIKNGISYTLQQIEAGKKIPNVGGYLNTMVQKEGVVDTTQIKRQEILKKKEKKEEIEYMKRQIKESLKMLQLEYMKEEDEIIHLLLDGNTTLRAEILKIVCSSRFSQYNHALSFDENMENPMVRAAYRNTIKKKLPEHFVKVSSVYETKIKTLKQQLVEL